MLSRSMTFTLLVLINNPGRCVILLPDSINCFQSFLECVVFSGVCMIGKMQILFVYINMCLIIQQSPRINRNINYVLCNIFSTIDTSIQVQVTDIWLTDCYKYIQYINKAITKSETFILLVSDANLLTIHTNITSLSSNIMIKIWQ